MIRQNHQCRTESPVCGYVGEVQIHVRWAQLPAVADCVRGGARGHTWQERFAFDLQWSAWILLRQASWCDFHVWQDAIQSLYCNDWALHCSSRACSIFHEHVEPVLSK
eukprot:2365164-Prymnesium_polylepis.4